MSILSRLGAMFRALGASERRGVLLSGLAGALLCLPLLKYHFAWDHGIYATIGDTLLRGGMAYRDAWEFRPPGIFYIYHAAFALLGRSEGSLRTLELLGIATTCAGLARLGAARFGSLRIGVVAALVFPFLYVPLGHWNTGHCESFQLPFLVWALAIWPRPEEESPARRCYASGLLVGAVVLLKTPGLLFAPLFLLDRLWIDRRRPTWAEKLRPSAATALGLATLPAAMLLYYGLRGILPTVYQAIFVYAVGYLRSAGAGGLASVHWYYFLSFVYTGLPAASLGGIGLLRTAVSRSGAEAIRWGVLAGAALVVVFLQGRHYLYHSIVLLPFFALAIGVSVASPIPPLPAGRPRNSALALAGLSLVLLAFVAAQQGPSYLGHWKVLLRSGPSWAAPDPGCAELGFSYEESKALAEEIRARTAPTDRVFLWTNLPLVHFLSDRRMAGPYSHVGMMIPIGEGRERLEALIRRLEEEKPRLVVTGGTGIPFQPGKDEELLDGHPEVRAFLARGYRPAGSQGAHRFWVRHE